MASSIPIAVGDVLILRASRSYTVHVVGRATRAGQLDFNGAKELTHQQTLPAAVAVARTLVAQGHRILLNDIDTHVWSVLEPDMSTAAAEPLRRIA